MYIFYVPFGSDMIMIYLDAQVLCSPFKILVDLDLGPQGLALYHLPPLSLWHVAWALGPYLAVNLQVPIFGLRSEQWIPP